MGKPKKQKKPRKAVNIAAGVVPSHKERNSEDHIRDYATAAFRFWARWGGRENYVNNILADMQLQRGPDFGCPTEAALVHKEKILQEHTAALADLEAVEKVLTVCKRMHPEVYRAVDIVYLGAFITGDNQGVNQRDNQSVNQSNIKMLVHHAKARIKASERQVFRYLAKARKLFAEERGLRCQ